MAEPNKGRTVNIEIYFTTGKSIKCTHKSVHSSLHDILKELLTPNKDGSRLKHFTRYGSEKGCVFINMVGLQAVEFF